MIWVMSCQNFRVPPNDPQISRFGENESHNEGMNCMSCHYRSNKAEGWFTLSGTIFDNPGNSTVELFTALGEPPIMVIEVDARGNFYTTEAIDYEPSGLYVGVRDPNGNLEIMERGNTPEENIGVGPNGEIFNGSCNACHSGAQGSTERLTIN